MTRFKNLILGIERDIQDGGYSRWRIFKMEDDIMIFRWVKSGIKTTKHSSSASNLALPSNLSGFERQGRR
jgi:hypothetical protein